MNIIICCFLMASVSWRYVLTSDNSNDDSWKVILNSLIAMAGGGTETGRNNYDQGNQQEFSRLSGNSGISSNGNQWGSDNNNDGYSSQNRVDNSQQSGIGYPYQDQELQNLYGNSESTQNMNGEYTQSAHGYSQQNMNVNDGNPQNMNRGFAENNGYPPYQSNSGNNAMNRGQNQPGYPSESSDSASFYNSQYNTNDNMMMVQGQERQSAPPRFGYKTTNIMFNSNGVNIVGILYTPEGIQGRLPALTFLGPILFVKEQAPMQYATRLASMGFVTLIYDPRNHGESEGEPRRYESPRLKIEDVSASIDFLQTLQQVDPEKIFAVGICQGASEILEAAVKDSRIKSIATVAGNYVEKENMLHLVNGEAQYQMRLERGDRARSNYESNGGRVDDLDYLPIVDEARKDVGLPQYGIWLFYHGWEPGTNWENRYTVMSDAELMRWDASLAAGNLTTPWLQIHSDGADGPEFARKFMNIAKSTIKQVKWMGDTVHTLFYHHPEIIDKASETMYWWFQRFVR